MIFSKFVRKKLAMNDKYKLLKENPGICKRLFGIEFGDFEIVLGKVQIEFDVFLRENLISNRGLQGNRSKIDVEI
jgi:hypothetical protein